jgi:hypothetical protein
MQAQYMQGCLCAPAMPDGLPHCAWHGQRLCPASELGRLLNTRPVGGGAVYLEMAAERGYPQGEPINH